MRAAIHPINWVNCPEGFTLAALCPDLFACCAGAVHCHEFALLIALYNCRPPWTRLAKPSTNEERRTERSFWQQNVSGMRRLQPWKPSRRSALLAQKAKRVAKRALQARRRSSPMLFILKN